MFCSLTSCSAIFSRYSRPKFSTVLPIQRVTLHPDSDLDLTALDDDDLDGLAAHDLDHGEDDPAEDEAVDD